MFKAGPCSIKEVIVINIVLQLLPLMPVLRTHISPLIRRNIQVLKSLIYGEVRYQLSVNRNAEYPSRT